MDAQAQSMSGMDAVEGKPHLLAHRLRGEIDGIGRSAQLTRLYRRNINLHHTVEDIHMFCVWLTDDKGPGDIRVIMVKQSAKINAAVGMIGHRKVLRQPMHQN